MLADNYSGKTMIIPTTLATFPGNKNMLVIDLAKVLKNKFPRNLNYVFP